MKKRQCLECRESASGRCVKHRPVDTFDREKERERRILKMLTDCVHFTGMQNETCTAGVRYDDLKTDPPTSLPCFAPFGTLPRGTCEQQRLTTREEAEAEVKAADESIARVGACLKAIREKHGKDRGLRGEMPCPVGCGGTLRYSIASYNGHVHGRCSTLGCAAWMQ